MNLQNIVNFLLIALFIVGCYNIFSGKAQGSSRIITIVLLIVLFIYFIANSTLFSTDTSLVANINNATEHSTISKDDIKSYQNNYSYSYWFYLDDWNYKYGEKKVLLARPDDNNGMNPLIFFQPTENNLSVMISCYSVNPPPQVSSGASSSNETSSNSTDEPQSTCVTGDQASTSSAFEPGPSPGSENFICTLKNINLQKWVNLIVVLNNRTLDLYLNGKLARTCLLPGVPRINNEANIEITPGNNKSDLDQDAGFSGYTSNVRFFPYDMTPEDAFNVYKQGFGGSLFGSLLNRYHITFTFYKDDQETAQINVL